MLNNRGESIKVCPLMLPKVLNKSLGIITYTMITYITCLPKTRDLARKRDHREKHHWIVCLSFPISIEKSIYQHI